MSLSVLYMSMSLDGYIAGPNDAPDNPGGDGFMRLHEWYGDFSRPSGPVGELFDEAHACGAILAGRRTVEQVDHWGGDRHGVRIFVPSHRLPGSTDSCSGPGSWSCRIRTCDRRRDRASHASTGSPTGARRCSRYTSLRSRRPADTCPCSTSTRSGRCRTRPRPRPTAA